MRATFSSILFAALSVVTMSEAVADPKIQPGLWEISATGTISGIQIPSATQQICFSDGDSANIKQLLPGGGSCALNNSHMSANSGSWAIQCKGELPITGSISLNFGNSSFSGTLNLTISGNSATAGSSGETSSSNANGNTTQISETISAHRVGNCSK
jgi:hypothetical protein